MSIIKPTLEMPSVIPSTIPSIGESEGLKRINGITWPSSSWQDGSRRSAFQPYKPTTFLTNLQRGNTQTNTPVLNPTESTIFEKAGKGDLTVQDLKTVADIDLADDDGLTLLMWSAAYGQIFTVKLLLQAGANVEIQGNRCESALHLAAAGGHYDVIKHLLSYGADVNVADKEGNTPLMYAILGDHPFAVNELLSQGADITLANCNNCLPYSLAIQENCYQAQGVLENYLSNVLDSGH